MRRKQASCNNLTLGVTFGRIEERTLEDARKRAIRGSLQLKTFQRPGHLIPKNEELKQFQGEK